MDLLEGTLEDFDVSDANSADENALESDQSDESESYDGTLSGSDYSDYDSTPEPEQKLSSEEQELFIVYLGPFPPETTRFQIRKLLLKMKKIKDNSIVDVRIQHRGQHIHGYVAFNDLETVHWLLRYPPNKMTFCCLIETEEYNALCRSLYDRSAFRGETRYIECSGLLPVQSTDDAVCKTAETEQWIKEQIMKALKVNANDNDDDDDNDNDNTANPIVDIRVFQNVRFPKMPGFAIIEMKNEEIAVNAVDKTREFWSDFTNAFRGWMDFVDPSLMTNRAILKRLRRSPLMQRGRFMDLAVDQTKVLVINHLFWKTAKSVLSKWIRSKLEGEMERISMDIRVIADSEGYPMGTAMVKFMKEEHAELVQQITDNQQLLGSTLSVQTYFQLRKRRKRKVKRKYVEIKKVENGVSDNNKDEKVIDGDGDKSNDDINDQNEDDNDNDDEDGDGDGSEMKTAAEWAKEMGDSLGEMDCDSDDDGDEDDVEIHSADGDDDDDEKEHQSDDGSEKESEKESESEDESEEESSDETSSSDEFEPRPSFAERKRDLLMQMDAVVDRKAIRDVWKAIQGKKYYPRGKITERQSFVKRRLKPKQGRRWCKPYRDWVADWKNNKEQLARTYQMGIRDGSLVHLHGRQRKQYGVRQHDLYRAFKDSNRSRWSSKFKKNGQRF